MRNLYNLKCEPVSTWIHIIYIYTLICILDLSIYYMLCTRTSSETNVSHNFLALASPKRRMYAKSRVKLMKPMETISEFFWIVEQHEATKKRNGEVTWPWRSTRLLLLPVQEFQEIWSEHLEHLVWSCLKQTCTECRLSSYSIVAIRSYQIYLCKSEWRASAHAFSHSASSSSIFGFRSCFHSVGVSSQATLVFILQMLKSQPVSTICSVYVSVSQVMAFWVLSPSFYWLILRELFRLFIFYVPHLDWCFRKVRNEMEWRGWTCWTSSRAGSGGTFTSFHGVTLAADEPKRGPIWRRRCRLMMRCDDATLKLSEASIWRKAVPQCPAQGAFGTWALVPCHCEGNTVLKTAHLPCTSYGSYHFPTLFPLSDIQTAHTFWFDLGLPPLSIAPLVPD